MGIDFLMLDEMVNVVNNDIDNTNEYNGFEKLLKTLSNEEVQYFIEECGYKLFENDKLSLIMWKTHPLQFNDYITNFIDTKLEEINNSLSKLDVELSMGLITTEQYENMGNGYLNAKLQINNLKNGFVSNIVHFLKNK